MPETFDPNADLAVSNEKRKKKSCTLKQLTITVVVLPYKQASMPKGKQRQTLEAQGQIRKVPIFRHASDAEVEEAIRTAFCYSWLAIQPLLAVAQSAVSTRI